MSSRCGRVTAPPRCRIRGWAYSEAVLAAVWCEQDAKDPAYMRACADLVEPLTR